MNIQDIDFEQFFDPADEGYSWRSPRIGYEELICLDGSEVVISERDAFGNSERDSAYQGDTYCLIKHPEKGWGYICFGWGSCPGCDALEGTRTAADLKDLAISLHDSVQWFSTREEFEEWFKAKDWKGTHCYYGSHSGFPTFAAHFGVIIPESE